MENQFNRRKFVTTTAVAGCALFISGRLSAINKFAHLQNEIPDPKKLNYCGYTCPKDCVFLEASVKNDIELKRKAYETWEMKERFGVAEFEPDKIFCFGCKTEGKPVGIRLQKCDVRNCCIDKKLDSCIECKDLKECEKDLWKKFPDFKNAVIKMQVIYLENRG
jgi:hypothetical protein